MMKKIALAPYSLMLAFLFAAPALAADPTNQVASAPAVQANATAPEASAAAKEEPPASLSTSPAAAPTLPATSSVGLGEQKPRILLVAKNEAMLASRFYGTIRQIHVQESSRFKAGQALVSFDCNELAAERSVAEAELKLHRTTNQANSELHAEKIIGNLEKNLSQVKVEEAAAKINAVSTKMRNCQIVAPFDGQVVEMKAKNHETLQPGSPIMLIQNSRNLEAHVHVPSKWMEWLKPGATFRAFIEETGKSYQAKVNSVGARVDPVSRTIKIYASLTDEHAELLPGMSGYAEFGGK